MPSNAQRHADSEYETNYLNWRILQEQKRIEQVLSGKAREEDMQQDPSWEWPERAHAATGEPDEY